MNKKEMRSHYLKLRRQMPEAELAAASKRICSELLMLEEIKTAKTVMVYISYNSEVDTHELLKQLIKAGKRVCAPLCETEKPEMTAYYIGGMDSLVKGAYGILEPKPGIAVNENDIDCILVPGCVFGRDFGRIGYGKGYYDRFMPRAVNSVKIGLCYDFCLTDAVEGDSFDVPVDIIVTENEVLRR